jgi:hypothetical protein
MNLKKPYEKPQIMKVQLRPEEAVLTACKLRKQTAPFIACLDPGTSCRVPAS